MPSWSSKPSASMICGCGLIGLVMASCLLQRSESFIILTTPAQIPRIQHQEHCHVLSNHYSVGCGAITALLSKQQSAIAEETVTTKTKRRTWEESFQLLVSYKEKRGNCNVPQRYKEDRRLGSWVDTQRRTKEKLSDERIVKLDDLGFSWSNQINEEKWEEMFEKLVQYAKENNGDCNVPGNNDNNDVNRELFLWVREQRKRKSLLSEERRTKLDKLGLIWEDSKKVKADQKWNVMYEHLQEYKQKYGDCRVPYTWKEDPTLGLWVHTQRQRYRKGQMHENRISKLEEIDFTWKVRDGNAPDYVKLDFNWFVKFGILLNFLEENGHCDVPRNNKKDKSLGVWVDSQRNKQRNGTLHDHRKERLDDICFTWNFNAQKDKQWRDKYEELKTFKETYGHLRLPETSRSLINWVYQQRVLFASGRMAQEKKALLDEFNFRWEFETRSA